VLFAVNNKSLFMENSQLHSIKTRNKSLLLQPSSHLTNYQEGPHYCGIKLPSQIKNQSSNVKPFKTALDNFLQFHSLYTAVEYFNQDKN
jgi:hypothetical protein